MRTIAVEGKAVHVAKNGSVTVAINDSGSYEFTGGINDQRVGRFRT